MNSIFLIKYRSPWADNFSIYGYTFTVAAANSIINGKLEEVNKALSEGKYAADYEWEIEEVAPA